MNRQKQTRGLRDQMGRGFIVLQNVVHFFIFAAELMVALATGLWASLSDKVCAKTRTITRDQAVKLLILIEGGVNLLVFLAKLTVGLMTGSLAILGDAIHSMTDMANNIVAWIVIAVSAKPADHEHPYGHRKFETLAVFGLASLLAALGLELVIRAVQPRDDIISTGTWELWLMIGVLVVNVCLATWQRYWARRLSSDILEADASHTFGDVLTTLVVIIGWQLSAAGYPWLDRLCALIVAGMIFYLAYGLFKRAVPVLVDEIAVDPEPIIRAIEKVKGVHNVLQLRSRWIGPTRAVDMVFTVDPELTTEAAHEIADEVEALLEGEFGIKDISIHIEPEK